MIFFLGTWLGCASPQALDVRPCHEISVSHSADPFVILWGGDTLLGDAAAADLRQKGAGWTLEHLTPLMANADAVVVNLEGPVTASTEPFSKKKYSYNADPKTAQALADAGVTLAGLANNHSMDRGPQGLLDTQRHLRLAGVEFFGAGRTRSEALRPGVIETPHGRVGIIGFTERYGSGVMAGASRPGVVALTEQRAHDQAAKARASGIEHLVAFVHWGDNYEAVQPSQRKMAGWLVDAGYDLVIGHGAHIQHPVEFVCGVPIVYSLGNLAFGTPGRFSPEAPGFGVVLTTEVGRDGFQVLEAHCIQTDNARVRFQPRQCEEPESRPVLSAFLDGAEVVGNRARYRR
jgi:poly-gamma-glutamate capsule biosynthesis protein CapA/YwtB (metallophosphatase superfamily)